MTYHKRYRGRRAPLGDLASTIGTAIDVAGDPYLPEVVCRIQQLKAIDHHESVPICADTPEGVTGGVGLHSAITGLRAYVYAQQNPWIYPVAVLAILGLPFWIGYETGRGNR